MADVKTVTKICPTCNKKVWDFGHHYVLDHPDICAAVMAEWAQGEEVSMGICKDHGSR